jgi:hypothetical protein
MSILSHHTEVESLEWPPLPDLDQFVPAAVPTKVSDEDRWAEIETGIDEFAVAKTVIEFLNANPEELKQRSGLYLRAMVTIKRNQVEYAQAQAASARKTNTSWLMRASTWFYSMEYSFVNLTPFGVLAIAFVAWLLCR